MTLFYGISKDMSFVPNNKKSWLEYLIANEGKKLTVEIDLDKAKRSLDQNALYWLYLGVIEKETGNLATDLHELFKRKFLPPIPKKILGTEFKIPASTSTLNKADFTEYIDKICSLTNVPIPVIEDKGKKPDYPTEKLTPTF